MIQFDDHIFEMGWFNHQLVPISGENFSLRVGFCCLTHFTLHPYLSWRMMEWESGKRMHVDGRTNMHV